MNELSPLNLSTVLSSPQVANWGFVAAGAADTQKPPEMISGNMTGGEGSLLSDLN